MAPSVTTENPQPLQNESPAAAAAVSNNGSAPAASALAVTTLTEDPYRVSQHTIYTPANRKLKISMIGAGVSGIMMAYKLSKNFENYDLKIYEKNADIGGVTTFIFL